ncbi:bifunctional diguanylate cyclase/phosphodiesterase, partial [Vibrio makurazakiensis]|uniref:putative bifunctional diguanylate cyclase/phosphodiesterase n=1 Tax=Vibrio makurazakiensis TaxID=2910250 RepID=UPI003D127DF7
MAKNSYSIWHFYLVTLILSIIGFGYLSMSLWEKSVLNVHAAQERQVLSFSNSVNSLLKTQEFFLEVLGLQIDRQLTLNEKNEAVQLLDKVIEDQSEIKGIKVLSIEGDLLTASSNLSIEKSTNYLSNPNTRSSFLHALNSTKMILGRTIYGENLQSNLIPTRFTVRDANHQPLLVMAAALTLDESKIFNSSPHLGPHNEVGIIRNDGYIQFYSKENVLKRDYSQAISKANHTTMAQQFFKKFHITMKDARKTNKVFTLFIEQEDVTSQTSLIYDQDFNMWVVSKVDSKYLIQEFLPSFILTLFAFITVHIILFLLLKKITTNEKEKRKQLLHRASHNLLTELPNRIYFQSNAYKWTNNLRKPFSLIYIDLDNFKGVNDAYGHATGDQILRRASERLKSLVPDNGLLIHESGDEFLLLTHSVGQDNVQQLITKLMNQIHQPFAVDEHTLMISASVGVAQFPFDGRTIEELRCNADFAMFKSKKTKNTATFFTLELQHKKLLKLKMEHKLRSAISNRDIYMYYQPQLDADGSLHGVEALVRWHDEELGQVSPEKFIGIAESSGQMPKLGQLIVEQSLSDIARIQEITGKEFDLSINISVQQLTMDNFIPDLIRQIETFQFPRHQLTLELTETMMMTNIQSIKEKLAELRSLGIKTSLDDFGTGYSSLNILKELPLNELKIDQSFVFNINSDPAQLELVKHIIEIGKMLNMQIVAEGVESHQHATLLKSMNCDILQG